MRRRQITEILNCAETLHVQSFWVLLLTGTEADGSR